VVLQGADDDPIVPVEVARDLAANQHPPQADLFIVPGLGHDVPIQQLVPTFVDDAITLEQLYTRNRSINAMTLGSNGHQDLQ
jgi:pimeloyl-ACP methyl ester carboxylesterase